MPNHALPAHLEVLRDAEIIELRAQGLTLRQIAEHVGNITHTQVKNIIQKHYDSLTDPNVPGIRRGEAEKLDMLEDKVLETLSKSLYKVSASGKIIYDPETKQPLVDAAAVFQGAQTLVRIAERRAKLLGLDMPSQVEMKVTADVLNPQVADWIEAARARREGRAQTDVVDAELVEGGPAIEAGPGVGVAPENP